jgi:hypothetical protein
LTRSARAIALLGLATAALAGCGSQFAPQAGSTVSASSSLPGGRGIIDRARKPYYTCMRAAGLPVVLVGRAPAEVLQVGALPAGPTIEFASFPQVAEGEQIDAAAYPQAQGAEVIGAALLYVHSASDAELTKIENCLDQGVKG